MEGETLGSYRVTGTIGRGGMGAVYLAQHVLLGRPAAVKVLLPTYSQDPQIVNRFFNEARAATAIRHPGIVEIYDFGFHTDGRAYIAMELLDGESLATRLAHGRIPLSIALALAKQTAGVLAAAHARGIVHRDLKPDNIFVVPDPEVPLGYRVKLLDFGIAKLTGDESQTHKTRTGAIIGTPSYMAPEQCRGVAVDYRADFYALGCILFEAVTGRTPFQGEGAGDVLAAHIYMPAPAVASLVADVPAVVADLVRHLLEKDPAARPQTTDEIVSLLERAATAAPGTQGSAHMITAPVSAPAKFTTLGASAVGDLPRRRSRRGVAIGGIVAVVVAAAIAAGVVLAFSGSTSDSPPDNAAAVAAAALPAADISPTDAAVVAVVAVDAMSPLPADVAIEIYSKPSGADIVIGGKRVGRTPYRGSLPRSSDPVVVMLRRPGYRDASLSIVPDSFVSHSVPLVRTASSPRRTPGPVEDKGSVNPFP